MLLQGSVLFTLSSYRTRPNPPPSAHTLRDAQRRPDLPDPSALSPTEVFGL